ncbi:MAG TPA: trypsin-like peptidase domain-containing protein [Ramlibacter sp.]
MYVSLGLLSTVCPASAVVILDSTWEETGGAPGSEPDGFAGHEELAQEAQFSATVSVQDADSWASGVWLGNDAEHGYVVTSGHSLGPDEAWEAAHPDELDAIHYTDMPDALEVVTDDGNAYPVSEIRRHPYFDHYANLAGTDMAVLVTETPVEGLGEQPSLYCGEDEGGQTITFVGYGSRGIGSVGVDPIFSRDGLSRAAGRTVVGFVEPDLNILRAYFLKDYSNADAPDVRFGPSSAVDEFQASIAHGDSGGPVFMETTDGWAIIGINTNSFTDKYDDTNIFTRISTQRDFITDQFSDVFFIDGEGGDCSTSEHAGEGNGDIYGFFGEYPDGWPE